MFKDTKEGETHSYNDGCGEPAHNPKLPKQIEERFDKEFPLIRETGIEEAEGIFFSKNDSDRVKSFIATILEEERERIIGEIKKFKIMEGSVIDKLEEKSEMERVTNLLNENLEIGYRQACMDIINLIKEDE